MRSIKINKITIANNLPFTLIAGPCQVENLDHSLMMAEKIAYITNKLGINFNKYSKKFLMHLNK